MRHHPLKFAYSYKPEKRYPLLELLVILVFLYLFIYLLAVVVNFFLEQYISRMPQAVVAEATITITPSPTPTIDEDRYSKLATFFYYYNCPLINYTDDFINAANTYNLDYRLLPAISFQESTCGKNPKAVNIFGFGKYRFETTQQAIYYVASAISGQITNQDGKYYLKADGDSIQILMRYNTVRSGYAADIINTMHQIGE